MEQDITYAFGSFRLQTVTQILCHEGEEFRLQPKVYRLLLYFLQHAGRLISREELFGAVWQGRIVEDTALRLAVNSLRKALHDESKNPRYILTTCKCGYRFLPEVTVEAKNQQSALTTQTLGFHYQPKTCCADTEQTQDVELAQLHVAFEQATDGKRNLVFLNGERGIGKTALLERFLANIRLTNFGVLRARCVSLDCADEPFLPLLEALELRCNALYGKQLGLFISVCTNLALSNVECVGIRDYKYTASKNSASINRADVAGRRRLF
jgi:DNA-binding winged helix-turn-helix (wHTH) protein